MNNLKIKGIIFDLGGIFIWDVWEHMYFDDNGLVNKYNLEKDRALIVGKRIYGKYAYTSIYKNEDWKKTEIKYWQDFIEEFRDKLPSTINVEAFIKMTDIFIHSINLKEMVEIVNSLKTKKIKIAACSNTTNFWYERAKEKFNFEELFPSQSTILSYKIGKSKSDGFEMFDAVVSALNIPKEECIFFDDRESNIIHSKKYGIDAILLQPDSKETPDIISKKLNLI